MPQPPRYKGEWARTHQTTKRTALTDQQREFLDWLVDPERQGSERAWAQAHNLSQSTVGKWKREPLFREAWDARLHELGIDPDRIKRVLDAMFAKAESGDVQAAKLVFAYADKSTPKRADDEDDVTTMSDEELARALLGE